MKKVKSFDTRAEIRQEKTGRVLLSILSDNNTLPFRE